MNPAHWDLHLGLKLWSSPTNLGILAYAEVPGYRIVAGQPHCDRKQLHEFALEFERLSYRVGKQVLYFDVFQSVRQALDFKETRACVHIGDAPIFSLRNWVHRARIPAGIRAQVQRAENHGVRVEQQLLPPPDLGEFQQCLVAWLRHKGLPPLRFLTTPFILKPWPKSGVWIARHNDVMVGFLTVSHSLFPGIPRVDVIVRSPQAPNGCSELLVSTAFQNAAEQGFQHATLGLAPLSKRSLIPRQRQPRWFDIVANSARNHGSRFYSCNGLEAFKAKFKPDLWEPLYCVSPGKNFSLRDGVAILRAFTGGSLKRYALESLLWRCGIRSTRHWPL